MQQLDTPAATADWIQQRTGRAPRVVERPNGFKVGPLTARQAEFTLDAAKGCSTARLTDPELEVPALNFLAKMSGDYHQAVATYLAAESAHRRFATTHDFDDPGHGDHQQRVSTARSTMVAASSALALAERALARIRGRETTEITDLEHTPALFSSFRAELVS